VAFNPLDVSCLGEVITRPLISKEVEVTSNAPGSSLTTLCSSEAKRLRSKDNSYLETANNGHTLYPLTKLVNENSEIRLTLLLAL
jgi:hypothetical protein